MASLFFLLVNGLPIVSLQFYRYYILFIKLFVLYGNYDKGIPVGGQEKERDTS